MHSKDKKEVRKPAEQSLNHLTKESLRKYLGYGLLVDSSKGMGLKSLLLKDALNSLVLK